MVLTDRVAADKLVAALDNLEASIRARSGRSLKLIADDESFLQWCNRLATEGLKIDGKPFSLKNRPALIPLYEIIPTHREDARGRIIAVQKATQLGLTVWEVLADLYMAAKWMPVNIGLFLPDIATASFKSEHRFMRMVRSAKQLHRLLTAPPTDTAKRRMSEGNILTRTLAESILMFLWTSGKVSTESRPMDVVSLDEVQEMSLAAIDKVLARMGDSEVAFALMLSTANMPEADINFWYLQGDQRVWHTLCRACGRLADLSDPAGIFPGKSIAYNDGHWGNGTRGTAPLDYIYICPHCRAWLPDAQDGQYIAQNPGASPLMQSLLLPRTISPRMTPRQMLEGYNRARTGDQKKSFWNRTLARPYLDPDQTPVTMAHCLAAAAEGMRIGLNWETRGIDCYMGIDQMGGFQVVIIKRRLPDGRQATVHVEAIFRLPTPETPNASPWQRADELMSAFNVVCCVVETLPNVDEARKFAARHPGRVFLAGYGDLKDDYMIWGDELSKSDKKTERDQRTRHTVTLNQYKCMQVALYRVRDAFCLFPDPQALVQEVIDDKGERKRVPILHDWTFVHFTKTALVFTEDREVKVGKQSWKERRPSGKVMKVGIDPHFSYANMLCDVAWARAHGTGMIILPETQQPRRQPTNNEQLQAGRTPLPVAIDNTAANTCGQCSAYPREATEAAHGRCVERSMLVRPQDPCCPLFDRRR